MPSFSDWPGSPLDAAQRAFDLLVMPPASLVFDARQVPGGPDRLMTLDELKRWLLRRLTPAAVRDAVWRQLVVAAQQEGPAWVVAAVGVAMPGLRALAGRLAAGHTGDTDDVDAELLAEFVRRLREIDPAEPKLLLRLLWAAERAGRKARYAQVPSDPLEFDPAGPRTPLLPWDHPDLVLVRAIAAGVVDEDEAKLIAATRLEGVPVEAAAAFWGIAPQRASDWRQAAEGKLVQAIQAGELTGMLSRVRPDDLRQEARRNGLSAPARIRRPGMRYRPVIRRVPAGSPRPQAGGRR